MAAGAAEIAAPASTVEFRNHLADLWTQTHRMVTDRFSLPLGSGFVDK
jgi:hypothetical protein